MRTVLVQKDIEVQLLKELRPTSPSLTAMMRDRNEGVSAQLSLWRHWSHLIKMLVLEKIAATL